MSVTIPKPIVGTATAPSIYSKIQGSSKNSVRDVVDSFVELGDLSKLISTAKNHADTIAVLLASSYFMGNSLHVIALTAAYSLLLQNRVRRLWR